MIYEIPKKIKKYEQGSIPPDNELVEQAENLIFEARQGEMIEVVHWARYPSYDFIFGVPTILNPKHKLEAGFFQFRSADHEIGREGIYIDINEMLDMLKGFQAMSERSKSNSALLWSAHEDKQRGE